MTTMPSDYYCYLGLARDATPQQIEKALHDKAKTVHPDKNKENPEAQKEFAFLTKIYHTLIDQDRRKKYDATLPPPASALETTDDLVLLWTRVTQQFIEQSPRYTKAFDAMRAGTPITIAEEVLVIGVDPAHSSLIGYLHPIEEQARVRSILAELTGRVMDFRLITGTTLEDWETIQRAETRKQQLRQADFRRVDITAAEPAGLAPETRPRAVESCDGLVNNLSTTWAGMDNRGLPQVRARFMLDQLPTLSRLEESLRTAGTAEDEIQRQLARVLERLGTLVGVDAALVALEYLRYRRLLGGF